MVIVERVQIKPVRSSRRHTTLLTFLRKARNIASRLGGDHTHSVEFEKQTLGTLGRFKLVHEKDLSADQWNRLDKAATDARMHGFREVHRPAGGRTGSITIVFDATDEKKVRAAFNKAYGFSVKPTPVGLTVEYRQ
ncbi:hypothetical protein HY994_01685 [Candidatus Micrarchaeota archaeon]|nr:hypothetical protein [Candidatus Micrarchaeota archaeon]